MKIDEILQIKAGHELNELELYADIIVILRKERIQLQRSKEHELFH
jgi:hypothetical protein